MLITCAALTSHMYLRRCRSHDIINTGITPNVSFINDFSIKAVSTEAVFLRGRSGIRCMLRGCAGSVVGVVDVAEAAACELSIAS